MGLQIIIPGLSQGLSATIYWTAGRLPRSDGEYLVINSGKKKIPVSQVSDLRGLITIGDGLTALAFCRFLTSPGIRHLFHDRHFRSRDHLIRAEVVPRDQMRLLIFREDGSYITNLTHGWASGREGVLSREDFDKLKIPLPSVHKDTSVTWEVRRTCLVDSRLMIKRHTTIWALQTTEERVTQDGGYRVRVVQESEAPKNIRWSIFTDL